MVERATAENLTRQKDTTTSTAWIDAGGKLRHASGELTVLENAVEDAAPLEPFLKLIDSVVDSMPGSGDQFLYKVGESWSRHDAAPIEVELKNGARRLLASHPHPQEGTVYLSIDIGRRTDQASRAQELLGDAIASLSEGFALYDENGRLVVFNEQYREMNKAVEDIIEPGVSWEMIMRTSARRGVYRDAIGREEEWVSERLANGIEFVQELELRHTDGTYYLVSVHPTQVGGFVVTRTDITAMKQAEAIERDSDLLVRKVLDTTSAIVVMARIADGEVLYRSPAAIDLFGNPKSALEQYSNSTDRADYVTEMLVDGRVDDFRLELVNRQGKRFPASMSGRIAEYKSEEVIVSHVTDLTEQIEAQALIRKVLEACPVPVQMTNAETGRLLFRSPETTALFGETDNAQSYYADPADRDAYIRKLKANGYVDDHKMEFINAKGHKFWGAVSARLIEFNGEQVIVSNTRDLTGDLEVQDELASQRELLFQNEKMSALGELLAGVAHELNNPLSVVVGHSLMLLEETEDPEIVSRIEKIGRSAERCAKIVKTFLAMARQRPARLEPLDVEALITTASDVAGFGLNGERMTISREIAADIPEVRADPEQITQVILNLIINAEQAMAQSGIGTRIAIIARHDAMRNSLEIVVEDDGPGVSEALRPRIFEPFFTTKEVGEGTGIGLAFCHRIVHSHGGQILLDPDYRTGSRFIVTLPAAPVAESEAEAQPQLAPDTAGAAILVVDDEVEVAELIAGILRKEGCQVEHANSGARALELLAEKHFDIMLSDLNMPEVDGRDLFEAVRDHHPHLRGGIAFITGDTMGVASQSLLSEANCPYLEKPVSPAELRGLVQNLLRNREGSGQ